MDRHTNRERERESEMHGHTQPYTNTYIRVHTHSQSTHKQTKTPSHTRTHTRTHTHKTNARRISISQVCFYVTERQFLWDRDIRPSYCPGTERLETFAVLNVKLFVTETTTYIICKLTSTEPSVCQSPSFCPAAKSISGYNNSSANVTSDWNN